MSQPDQLFKSLEHTESRKNAVFISIAGHFALLAILIAVPLFLLDPPNLKRFAPVMLAPPIPHDEVLEVTHWKPVQPRLMERPEPVPVPRLQPELKMPEPAPIPKPKAEEFQLPSVKVDPKPALVAENKAEAQRPEPPKEVKTDVFGSSAKPTVELSPKQVQTGGFGDPNGMKGDGRPDKPANIASLGSFDLPVGLGAGNGTGGAKGVKGVVGSAGFGNGVATDQPGGGGGRGGRAGGVQKSGFADAASASTEGAARRHDAEPAQTAVEITYKAKPDYTQEARELAIEGEVLVRVVFQASGHIKILEVTRGLGHGLDENVIRAAEKI